MLSWTTTGASPATEARLTKKESHLLNLLRENAGRCLSRGYLLQTVWGYGPAVRTRTLDVHIQRLRKKMELQGVRGQIQTILGNGYCWQSFGEPAYADPGFLGALEEKRSVA